MTDKLTQTGSQASQELSRSLCQEQIIINGINIFKTLNNWADFLSKEWCSDERPIVELVKIYISDINGQLARKTQECEELISEKDFYLQKIEVLDQECEELKKENKKLLEKCLERKCKIIKLIDENATKEVIYKINGKSAKTVANKVKEIAAIVEGKDCKYNRYRKALEEIEEVLKVDFQLPCASTVCSYPETCKDSLTNHGTECMRFALLKIKDIVKKAKGEE